MLSENSQAPITAKAGLTNSDGWIDWPATISQRLRALDLRAEFQRRPVMAMLTIKHGQRGESAHSARFRNDVLNQNGDRQNRKNRVPDDEVPGSYPSRSATAGLAAKDSTMPQASSSKSAASSSRSMVHHHSATGVLRSRANMDFV